VESFSTLKDFPRSDEGLLKLKKIASFVKPIMRKRGWRLPLLAEFYPAQHNLLGTSPRIRNVALSNLDPRTELGPRPEDMHSPEISRGQKPVPAFRADCRHDAPRAVP
jgi:hypothetical protein